MVIRILISLWILLFAMLIHSCEKEENIPLSDLELSLAPYNMNDTVVFLISNLDTVEYHIYNRSLTYEYGWKNAPVNNATVYVQTLKILFTGNDNSKLTLQIVAGVEPNFASINLTYDKFEEWSIYTYSYKEVLDTLTVNDHMFSSVYWFEEHSFEQRFYIKPGKGLIKIEFYSSIFEIIE